MSKEKPDDTVVAISETRLSWKCRLQVLLTGFVGVRTITPVDVEPDTLDPQRHVYYVRAYGGECRIETRWPIHRELRGMTMNEARKREEVKR